ncbi:MAG: DoxX family membrane protein [Fibrobacter sp.]|nr:DoxX family membrane protein [Fibrobacter sp.]
MMILPGILFFVAILLTAFGIAEISFPETFLTLTDKEFFLNIFPNAWKYGMHIGIVAIVIAAILIIPAWKLHKTFSQKMLETLLRLGLGGMFIAASIFKIQDPHEFATLVAQYQFLPSFINNFFALIYPQFELWFGLALIFTPYTREAGLAIFLMFISFIIALSWALFHDLDIVCGCFQIEGSQNKNEAWTSLIRDLVLIGPNFWLMLRPNKSLIGLWKPSTKNKI